MNSMFMKSHSFSVYIIAVPPEEIRRGSFASVFPFYFTHVIFVRKGSCFEDSSPTPSFQVAHPTSVIYEVLLMER
jgi:hypothetical protein